ncbi:hypothetical protein Pgy4_35158, partial [Pseudomonas savastanoi pv. glycinea str. race 4]
KKTSQPIEFGLGQCLLERWMAHGCLFGFSGLKTRRNFLAHSELLPAQENLPIRVAGIRAFC